MHGLNRPVANKLRSTWSHFHTPHHYRRTNSATPVKQRWICYAGFQEIPPSKRGTMDDNRKWNWWVEPQSSDLYPRTGQVRTTPNLGTAIKPAIHHNKYVFVITGIKWAPDPRRSFRVIAGNHSRSRLRRTGSSCKEHAQTSERQCRWILSCGSTRCCCGCRTGIHDH